MPVLQHVGRELPLASKPRFAGRGGQPVSYLKFVHACLPAVSWPDPGPQTTQAQAQNGVHPGRACWFTKPALQTAVLSQIYF